MNDMIRKWFNNIALLTDIAAKCQFDWVGHAAHLPQHHIQQQLLLSWTNNPRKTCHPQFNPCAIHKIIPKCDPKIGITSTWLNQAAMKGLWNLRIKVWWTTTAQPPLPKDSPPLPDFSLKLWT